MNVSWSQIMFEYYSGASMAVLVQTYQVNERAIQRTCKKKLMQIFRAHPDLLATLIKQLPEREHHMRGRPIKYGDQRNP